MLADAMRYVYTMYYVVYTYPYIPALSMEQHGNAENVLQASEHTKAHAEWVLLAYYLKAGPNRQKGEYCFEDRKENNPRWTKTFGFG